MCMFWEYLRFTLNYFETHNTVSVTLVIIALLYIKYLKDTHTIPENVYPLTSISPISLTPSSK